MLTAALAGVTQAPAFFKGLNDTPSEFSKTKNSFLSWFKEDDAWVGMWSSFPEGVVDMASMNLTDSDFIFYIENSQGEMGGYFTSQTVCKIAPLSFGILMLDGKASASKATAEVFDIVQGRRLHIANFSFSRDGNVLTVKQIDGVAPLIEAPLRLGKHPSPEESTSTVDAPERDSSGPCSEMKEFFKGLGDRK